jgi:hypothetical protein
MILGAVAALLFVAWQRWAALQWRTEQIQSLNLSFQRPPDLITQALNSDEKESKIAYRGTPRTDSEQPYLVTIRSEDGLKLAISLTKQELVPMVLGNSEKAFPARFPEFTKVSTRQYEIDGHKAGEFIFSYKAPAGSKTKQRFVVIDKDGNTAIYLALQAKETDFSSLDKQIFERLINSIQLR